MKSILSFLKTPQFPILLFFILSLFATLFPPFNWGEEYLLTKSERQNSISKLLPIKEYNFLFSSNKNYFPIGLYTISKELNIGKKFPSNFIWDDTISCEMKVIAGKVNRDSSLEDSKVKQLTESSNSDDTGDKTKKHKKYKFNFTKPAWEDPRVKQLNNYDNNKDVEVVDYNKPYTSYKIVKPYYYLLSRKIIAGELILNYVLSLLLSALIFIIGKHKIVSLKLNNNKY